MLARGSVTIPSRCTPVVGLSGVGVPIEAFPRPFPGFHTSGVTGTLTLAFLVKTLSIRNIGIMGPGQLTNLAIAAGIES